MDGSSSYRGRLWSSKITSPRYVTQMYAWKRPYVPHVSFLNYTIFILHCPRMLNLLCLHKWCNESARQRCRKNRMPPRVVSESTMAIERWLMLADVEKLGCPTVLCRSRRWLSNDGWCWPMSKKSYESDHWLCARLLAFFKKLRI